MTQKKLVPCPSCDRHVFAGSCACPFCATALPGACASHVASKAPVPRGRLKRAARMAAAASLLGATSCSNAVSYGTSAPWDSGVESDSGTDTAAQTDQATDAADDGGTPPSDR